MQIAFDIDLAARIGFAEAKRGLDDDVARGAVGLDVNREGGVSLAVSRYAAVWKNDSERLVKLQRVKSSLKPVPVHGRSSIRTYPSQ